MSRAILVSRCPCLFEALTDPNGPDEGAVRGEEVEVLQGVSLEAWKTALEFIYAGTQPRPVGLMMLCSRGGICVDYAHVWLGEQCCIELLSGNRV